MTSLSFWTTFYAMMSTDSRVVWTIFLVLQLVNTVNSLGAHVRDAQAAENSHDYMCTPSARVDPPPLQYSRHQLCCLCLPPASMLRPSLPSDSWASDTVSRRCAPTELADASRIRSGSSTTAGLTTLTLCLLRLTLPSLILLLLVDMTTIGTGT